MSKNNDIIEELILNGSIEVVSLDDSGNFLYGFTKNVEQINPELYNTFIENIRHLVMLLWEKGFVEINDIDKDMMIKPSMKAILGEGVEDLDPSLQFVLRTLLEQSAIDE